MFKRFLFGIWTNRIVMNAFSIGQNPARVSRGPTSSQPLSSPFHPTFALHNWISSG